MESRRFVDLSTVTKIHIATESLRIYGITTFRVWQEDTLAARKYSGTLGTLWFTLREAQLNPLSRRTASASPLTVLETAKEWNYAIPYGNASRKLIARDVI